MGLGGNVIELEETEFYLMNDDVSAVRGAQWDSPAFGLLTILRVSTSPSVPPSANNTTTGFRVASIPEPSSQLLVLWGAIGLLLRRRNARG